MLLAQSFTFLPVFIICFCYKLLSIHFSIFHLRGTSLTTYTCQFCKLIMSTFTLEQDVCISCNSHFFTWLHTVPVCSRLYALEDKVRICFKFPLGNQRANTCSPRKRQDSRFPEQGTCVLERINLKKMFLKETAWNSSKFSSRCLDRKRVHGK